MKTKNIYWIIAGAINFLTFVLHLIGGQIDHIDPMLATTLTLEQSAPLVGAWHMVTLILIATSVILLLAGFGRKYSQNYELISFVGYLNLLFCLPFIIASFYYSVFAPQWILFLPIGVLTVIGMSKAKSLL